jgi:glycosyltransferase involved in cell wall biosynthesis
MKPHLLVAADFIKTGGMDVANHAVARYLAEQGGDVHLVAHSADSDLTGFPNVVFHRVLRPAGSYLLGEPLIDRTGRRLARELAWRNVRVLANGGNCRWGDANWVHYVHAAYRPQPHGSILRRTKWSLSHRSFLRHERRAIPRARVVIANSNATRRHLIELVGVPAERIHTVYYGIEPDQFRPATRDERRDARAALNLPAASPVVCFVGGLGDRRKGFDTVFSAWAALCGQPTWDATLVVVGVGAELPEWKARAADGGIGNRIRFLGFRSDVPRVLSACDALVAPTRYEAYGLGVREALCAGLPAFVSASAGIAETYPPALQSLLLPDPDDAADLASRLASWLPGIDRHRDLVSEFSREFRGHTWRHMAAQIVDLMETAV